MNARTSPPPHPSHDDTWPVPAPEILPAIPRDGRTLPSFEFALWLEPDDLEDDPGGL